MQLADFILCWTRVQGLTFVKKWGVVGVWFGGKGYIGLNCAVNVRCHVLEKPMRKTFILLIALLLFESLVFGQQRSKNDIQAFNSFLGKEKAKALNAAVASFDQFLLKNYGNLNSCSSRTKAFLEQIDNLNEPDSLWTFETEKNIKIIETFETSGLRKDIWLYENEEYESKYNIHEFLKPEAQDSIPITNLGELDIDLIEAEIIPITEIDSAAIARFDKEMEERNKNLLLSNARGKFFYGLAKFNSSDSLILDYVEATGFNISPAVIAGGFLDQDINFEEPFIKRIVAVEFYFWIMKWDIARKEINK